MTIKEFEKTAIGIDTGFRDREGNPIKVGDKLVMYHRTARQIDDDEDINWFSKEDVCGTGHKGYVYTGKIVRYRTKVTFSFDDGVCFGNFWIWSQPKGKDGRILTVLVDNQNKYPKLTKEEIETDLSEKKS